MITCCFPSSDEICEQVLVLEIADPTQDDHSQAVRPPSSKKRRVSSEVSGSSVKPPAAQEKQPPTAGDAADSKASEPLAAAQTARRRWRQGRRLDRWRQNPDFNFWSLSFEDQQILQDFDSKILFNDMLKANKEYGHGVGAPEQGLSIEQIAIMEYRMRDTTKAPRGAPCFRR